MNYFETESDGKPTSDGRKKARIASNHKSELIPRLFALSENLRPIDFSNVLEADLHELADILHGPSNS